MLTRVFIVIVALATLAVGLATPTFAQTTSSVTGTVTYRTRNLLPPTARVVVQLVDVSRADAAATVIAEQIIEPQGAAPPYAFTLAYDPAQITDRGIYAVQAAIRDGERLLFISTRRTSVITAGNPTSNVEIVVDPAPASTGSSQRITIESPAENTLIGSPVTITGRADYYPQSGMLSYRFRDERGTLLGSGDLPVSGDFRSLAAFTSSLSFTLPPEGGPVRVEIFERDSTGAERGLATRILFVARPQAIRISSPAPDTVVTSPLEITGELGRLPSEARLIYRILASDGRQLGQGNFPVPGNPGRPALYRAALPFEASPEGDRIQVQLFDQNQATGEIIAQTSVTLGVAPKPQQIIIDSPGANAYVGTPVVVTGRTVRYPASGALGYAIYNSAGAQIGGGAFPVSGSLAVGGSFSASLGFGYPAQGGPLRIDLYDQDPTTGAFRATASVTLRSVPLQQQIVIESPAPGTQVGVPVVLTGRTARYPSGGVLQYRIASSLGEQLGSGSFPVQGPVGEPARFNASLSFNPPAFSGPLRAEVFETDQFGNVTASAAIDLRWAAPTPAQRQIVIETPAPNTLVGSPVVITGRATFYPVEGTLSYRVRDSAGNELGSGFVQARAEAGGARFVISAAFRTIPGGGPITVEVYAIDQASGSVIARDSVQLQQGP